MPRFKLHHTHHDDKDKDNTASVFSSSSGRNSRDSKQLLTQSSSPPPYTEGSKNQHYGLSNEDKAAATRSPGAIDQKFQSDAGVGASYSSSQSDSKGTDAGPSTVRASLQLCQHENLTFERLQFIKGILYEKYRENGIDIIRNTKETQHQEIEGLKRTWPPKVWACHADDLMNDTTGTFRMKLSSNPHKLFGHKRDLVVGLELHVCWKLEIWGARSGNSRDRIDQFLPKSDHVQLCPHRMMNDPWIKETVYNFLAFRDVPKPSSMDQYMQYTHKSKPPPPQLPPAYDCDRCKTHVEVSYEPYSVTDEILVKITRYLGEGIGEYDPAWLAQCGIEP